MQATRKSPGSGATLCEDADRRARSASQGCSQKPRTQTAAKWLRLDNSNPQHDQNLSLSFRPAPLQLPDAGSLREDAHIATSSSHLHTRRQSQCTIGSSSYVAGGSDASSARRSSGTC